MSMRCRAGMCHAPSPPHHRLLPRAKSCLALCPNPTTPTLRIAHLTPYPLSILPLLACHSLPTRFPSLSRRTSHPFVVSTPALSESNQVSFHGVRAKTFSTHVTTEIVPDVREMELFTHGRASLNFTIIPMCTPVSQCHVYAMPGRDVPCHHTFAPLPCTCTRLSLSQVFDHYQHFANSVVEVYISFKKKFVIFENVKSLIHLLL